MRAKRIIEQIGAFDPDEMARLQSAFNTAWEKLKPSVAPSNEPEARELLATIVVSIAKVRADLGPDQIALEGLGVFQNAHGGRFISA